MQAIDGFRLSFMEGLKSDNELIIPASFMSELVKLLPDNGMVKIQSTQNKVLFSFDNTLLVSALLSGSYPDVTLFMAQEHANRLVLDTKNVIAVLRQASIFAREAVGNVIKVTANTDLKFEVQTHEDSYVNEIEAVEGTDNEVVFGVNCGYFLEALTKVDTDTFSLQVETGNNPIIIESGEFRHVIMPMSIKEEQ
jgi:DNA polymerase-3 subunit beta